MRLKVALFFLLCMMSVGVSGQDSLQQKLKNIISSDRSVSARQASIDSLMAGGTDQFEPKDLAESYHDLGYRWYHNVAWKHDGNDENLDKALMYFEKAAAIKRYLTPVDQVSLKRTLYNMGVIYRKNDELFKSIKSFSELVSLSETDKRTLNSYRALGKAYGDIGDYFRAVESFDKLISEAGKSEEYLKQLLQAYYRRAETYAEIDMVKYSDRIAEDLLKADSIGNLPGWAGYSYDNEIRQLEGNRLLRIGQYDRAVSYYNETINSLDPADTENLAIVYNSLGLTLLKADKPAEALAALEKSAELSPQESLVYENLADYYLKAGSFSQAANYYKKAISLSYGQPFDLKATDQKPLQPARYKYYMLHNLIGYGKALLDEHASDGGKALLNEAMLVFKTADELVDIIRFQSYESRSRLYWREKGAALYLNAVKAASFLGDKPLAYYFMEKNKAILLLEDISENEAIEYANIPY
ncbi:MAG: hypothetical protein WBA74_03770, partial [Cyclobacteriaceae bacterium]